MNPRLEELLALMPQRKKSWWDTDWRNPRLLPAEFLRDLTISDLKIILQGFIDGYMYDFAPETLFNLHNEILLRLLENR